MSDYLLLQQIHANQWIADLLARFDFDVARVVNGPVEPVRLSSGAPLEMIAGDASGGAFLLAGGGEQRAVVYTGSEGEGGLIAANLREALALVVGLPSLHDALARPFGEDDGTGLRAWLAQIDEEIRADWPELDEARRMLRDELNLPPAEGLLEAFHRAARDEEFRPINEDGDFFEPMVR